MGSGRMHEKGTIHLVTNRCEQGCFLLLPSKEVNHIIQYWFARAMEKYGAGLELFAFVFLSNHFHLLLRDTQGSLAQFMGYFQGNVAKAVNRAIGRGSAHFWQGHYDDQIIEGERTFWKKYLYVLANAVKSGLVRRTRQWVGWSSLSMALCSQPFAITALNKTAYHHASRGRTKPDKARFMETDGFALTPPPMLTGQGPAARRKTIARLLRQAEQYYRSRWKGPRPLGIPKVLAQKPTDRPAQTERRPRRRFACDCPQRERELTKLYRRFIAAYKGVFDALRKSAILGTVFRGEWPLGSYPPACWQPVTDAYS